MEIEEENYSNILDNVNVSEGNDFVAFFKAIGIFIGIVFLIFFIIISSANIIIDNLSLEKQMYLEKVLSSSVRKQFADLKTDSDKNELSRIKKLEAILLAHDNNLAKKGHFEYHIIKADEVNAFVTADGNIYFTDALLKKMPNDELLTFIMAHEMAHYIHKDHLRHFSHGIAAIIISMGISVLVNDSDIINMTSDAINFTEIKHSQRQEINADKFANDLTLDIYHSNQEVIKFFQYIKKEQGNSNLLYFFASHPSPQKRIELISVKK